MAKTKLATASVLAFERKLDVSDALFFSGQWNDRANVKNWPGVSIQEKSVRGTISNRLKAKDVNDPTKLDAKIQDPNLQTVDVAMLPSVADTLVVRFTLKILAGAGTPSACNNADYQAKLGEVVSSYVSTAGFSELASRYAQNLANGRYLWRNRLGAEQVETRIALLKEGQVESEWSFDSKSISMRKFERSDALSELTGAVEAGLSGGRFVLLEVTSAARVGKGQEVYPSQELILDKASGKGSKSKTLYAVGGVAAMHSQKVGNALRTIDTWYPKEGGDVGPIAVEPYGSVTSQGHAYRQPKEKTDFYNLLDSWVLKDQVPPVEQQHFVMATLVRGGVFGAKA